jgi:hypothetical protein
VACLVLGDRTCEVTVSVARELSVTDLTLGTAGEQHIRSLDAVMVRACANFGSTRPVVLDGALVIT